MKNAKAIQIIQIVFHHKEGSSSHKRTVRTSIFRFQTPQTLETPLCHLVSRKKKASTAKTGIFYPVSPSTFGFFDFF